MTRDEAVKIIGQNLPFNGSASHFSESWVDAFVALGMLELDEPKSVRDKIHDAWCSLSPSQRTIPDIIGALEDYGLTIVEK